MTDNVPFQTTTLATPASTEKVESLEVAANVKRQRVMTAGLNRVSANFTRPADTTAYAAGDLCANSTTAGSVVALSWTAADTFTTTQAAAGFAVRRAHLKKSSAVITNAAFRLHLFGATVAAGLLNGDNGVFSPNDATYLGYIDFPSLLALRDSAHAFGGPAAGVEIAHAFSSGQTLYGLLEVRGAYTPVSAEVFTVELEVWRL